MKKKQDYHYYQFHKPGGCVTALCDANRPTIMNYLAKYENIDMTRVRPVGRLDLDTEGLLILTDDGTYNQYMTNPTNQIEKKYLFYALGMCTEEKKEKLRNGMVLPRSEEIARPAKMEVIRELTLQNLPEEIWAKLTDKVKKNRLDTPVFIGYMTVTEGKKHEIKRLLKGIECYCIYLKRVSMGNVILNPELALGEVCEFTPEEIE